MAVFDTIDSRADLPVRREACAVSGCRERPRYRDDTTGEPLCGPHYRARREPIPAAPAAPSSPPASPESLMPAPGTKRMCVLCGNPQLAKGLCPRHHSRARDRGIDTSRELTPAELAVLDLPVAEAKRKLAEAPIVETVDNFRSRLAESEAHAAHLRKSLDAIPNADEARHLRQERDDLVAEVARAEEMRETIARELHLPAPTPWGPLVMAAAALYERESEARRERNEAREALTETQRAMHEASEAVLAKVEPLQAENRKLRDALVGIVDESCDPGAVACARDVLGMEPLDPEEAPSIRARGPTPAALTPEDLRRRVALLDDAEDADEEADRLEREAQQHRQEAERTRAIALGVAPVEVNCA